MVRIEYYKIRKDGNMFRAIMKGACFAFFFLSNSTFGQQTSEHHDDELDALDTVVVESTRSGRRISEEPIRVEVIPREEIEEKLLMTPGNIAMLVAETNGVRVQVNSPGLGSSSIRMQAMRGRYTQLLADGLPLHGGQSSSIGLLQIPPTDLGSVEIIKGAASALYGPSALGGVINLISRRPSANPQYEFLLNGTSRGGIDLTGYSSTPLTDEWSMTLTGGFHDQDDHDLDEDGWLDTPAYQRWTVRPRFFWTSPDGAKATLTLGSMTEHRSGGTVSGRLMPDGQPYQLLQDTSRLDAGIVVEIPVRETDRIHLRASATETDHHHRFGSIIDFDEHHTGFAEASYVSSIGSTTWLAGIALQTDRYQSQSLPAFDYRYSVPALFLQAEYAAQDNLIFAASGRLDAHSEYGNYFSPRLSVLYRPGNWTLRTSIGRGFYAPTPFVEEIEAAGLSQLEPLDGLEAETAMTRSLDVGYTEGPWETGITLFASEIRNAVRLIPDTPQTPGPGRVRLVNTTGMTNTQGLEFFLRYRWHDFLVTSSYVYTRATEPDTNGLGRQSIPLTPRHSGGLVAMWEKHGRGRIGFEAYYTGKQSLADNPYRNEGDPYFELGLLGEINIGSASIFLNLENLLDVRQSSYHPLTRPYQSPEGSWTISPWAPVDGFTVNGGIRLRF